MTLGNFLRLERKKQKKYVRTLRNVLGLERKKRSGLWEIFLDLREKKHRKKMSGLWEMVLDLREKNRNKCQDFGKWSWT